MGRRLLPSSDIAVRPKTARTPASAFLYLFFTPPTHPAALPPLPQLLRIWSGERGAELAAGPGLEFRDQAALLAILYHTQQIEDKYGAPPGGYLPKPPASAEQR
jgi:hypothetical protein